MCALCACVCVESLLIATTIRVAVAHSLCVHRWPPLDHYVYSSLLFFQKFISFASGQTPAISKSGAGGSTALAHTPVVCSLNVCFHTLAALSGCSCVFASCICRCHVSLLCAIVSVVGLAILSLWRCLLMCLRACVFITDVPIRHDFERQKIAAWRVRAACQCRARQWEC